MDINFTPGDGYAEAVCDRSPNVLQVEYNDWQKFLNSYGDDDRGRKALGIVEISHKGDITADGMIENLLYNNDQLVKLAGEFRNVPVARKDIDNYKRLQEIAIKPTIDLLTKELPKMERERGGQILMPREYARVANVISRIYRLRSFQLGRSLLAHEGLLSDLTKATLPYEVTSKTFYVKWGGRFRCRPGITGKKDFAVIVFYAVDSCSGRKILLNAIEAGNREILHNESPDDGIKQVILGNSWSRRVFTTKIEEILQRRQLSRLSPSSLLRETANPIKFGNYVNVLYGEKGESKGSEQITYIS